jgi:hypothetical protein
VKLREYSILFFVVTGVLALVVASPALSRLLVFPRTEFFTELWILGSTHMGDNYPYNITSGNNYTVFLGIRNQLGYGAYYLIEAKFRNQNQSAPNSFNHTPSSLPPLFNITAFVADQSQWELPLTFSFDYTYNTTLSQVEVRTLKLNDVTLNISNCTIAWNSARKDFFGSLFFETWIYNEAIETFQYHERYVSLRFNMTV